jgi:oligopeptide/dipeptide ABC transporter ATP-binding protein
MAGLRKEFHTAIIMITHDLGVVAEMADHVVVMYVGQGVEKSHVHNIFSHPKHPYTQGLMASVPSITSKSLKLYTIEGTVPDLLKLPEGCRFEPRCPKSMAVCKSEMPTLEEVGSDHWVACWLYH